MLSIRDLTIRIGTATPVSGINFDIERGEMLGLVGESGSGKSLTMRAILRLLPDHAQVEGSILWNDTNLATIPNAEIEKIRGRQIAAIFQEPMTALNPILPVGLQITESLSQHLNLRGAAARRRAIDLLDRVGIPDARRRLDSYPHEFSGGMRQRAMIAIALAGEPKLLLADEPTTALDVTIQDQILKLLLRLRDELSMSVILVTHDLGIVAGTCDRVAVLYAGRIMETGPTYDVFTAPAHAYTLGLMRSLPDAQHARQPLQAIPGTPPDPARLPPGCRFAPRCFLEAPACNAAPPPLVQLSEDHATACIRAEAVRKTVAAAA